MAFLNVVTSAQRAPLRQVSGVFAFVQPAANTGAPIPKLNTSAGRYGEGSVTPALPPSDRPVDPYLPPPLQPPPPGGKFPYY
jgi:hypothetical protein